MTVQPINPNHYVPHSEYAKRLETRLVALEIKQQHSRQLWIARRILFGVIALAILLAIDGTIAWWWFLLPVAGFIALMVRHQTVLGEIERLTRSVKFYERGLARVDDNWMGTGETGEQFADKTHAYAEDLDLFGQGSLFQLLSTARTQGGEAKLACWLKAPAEASEIHARQAAVEELRLRLDLREELSLLGAEVRAGIHTEEVEAWGKASPVLTASQIRTLTGVTAVTGMLAVATVIIWLAFGVRLPMLAALIALTMFYSRYGGAIKQIISAVERPSRDLNLLAEILARLECEPVASPKLIALRSKLDTEGLPPSQQIEKLNRLLDILGWTKNQFFAPIAFLLLLPAQVAIAVERWRQTTGSHIGDWLDTVAEIEALNSLANFAYERPDNPFPELVETEACFDGEALGHPLIATDHCVRNHVRLDSQQQLLIVSGSNMSGKSTLMRTVGINVVLALAGAPVCARRLRVSPLTIGASIHILDSLQSGASRFYAEITRLKQIVELTNGRLPLLFLLDEILSGTNSHDRRIGAEAVVRGLVEHGAIGLVTTHDLALTRIAETLGERAANVHFEDRLENGKMIFDYRMQPGVVQRSNALELMRAVGIEV
ncbi:MAG: DNA mismatch repair protein MutS [Acidobacteria bacterium]|nr:DNA mismatch repair protein MutS [Acidobacteriota bacterium]